MSNSLPTWPASPLPAGLSRVMGWGANVVQYDSGAYQGVTPYQKPLYQYAIPYQNFTEVKQQLIKDFYNGTLRGIAPFLMKDPYDFKVASVLGVRSGFATGSGALFLYDTNSFMVRADLTTIGSMFSTLSGFVNQGTNYTYDQDTGLLTIVLKAVTDVWGVRSMEYFRKMVFSGYYAEQATIWNIFNTTITLNEVV